MTIVYLRGALGNQLWQFAAGWINACVSGSDLIL